MKRRLRAALLLAASVLLTLIATPLTTAHAAPAFAKLNGAGSSWAEPAIDQWTTDVRSRGISINYSGTGSAAGRSNYAAGLVDFAGSDIAFLNGQDKVAGGDVEYSQYGYSYLPITAGGTSFMYHLTVAGKRITNLRLSGETITKIFTGKIKSWSDPQITKEYGSQLPSEPIVPVVRSDGSGATAQFTAWMNSRYSSLWNAFCASSAGVTSMPCGETEFYPSFTGAKSQNSSTAVANYITSSYGEGSIGYDEYSYALNSGYPVVKVLNPAGYYVLPTASNVAVALTGAVIDLDANSLTYLQQNLSGVYTNPDPRSYPLSSYSYLIVPRKNRGTVPPTFTANKGYTLSTWANYFMCGGQAEMANLGYSPLPINLVKRGLDQVDQIPNAAPTPNRATLSSCANPTFLNGVNTLLKNAVYPSACDKVGSALYGCGSPATTTTSTTSTGAASSTGNTAGGTSPTGGNTGSSGGTTNGSAAPGAAATGAAAASTGTVRHVDPNTGQIVGADSIGSAGGADGVPAQAVMVSATHDNKSLFGALTAVEIVAAVLIPPVFGTWLARRRKRGA